MIFGESAFEGVGFPRRYLRGAGDGSGADVPAIVEGPGEAEGDQGFEQLADALDRGPEEGPGQLLRGDGGGTGGEGGSDRLDLIGQRLRPGGLLARFRRPDDRRRLGLDDREVGLGGRGRPAPGVRKLGPVPPDVSPVSSAARSALSATSRSRIAARV